MNALGVHLVHIYSRGQEINFSLQMTASLIKTLIKFGCFVENSIWKLWFILVVKHWRFMSFLVWGLNDQWPTEMTWKKLLCKNSLGLLTGVTGNLSRNSHFNITKQNKQVKYLCSQFNLHSYAEHFNEQEKKRWRTTHICQGTKRRLSNQQNRVDKAYQK